jgi:ribonuclease J
LDSVSGDRIAPAVDVIPLGGVGEFGMNMLVVACGDTAIVVDAGVMFPEPDLLGVDLVIPDMSALDAYRGSIRALVLTHGHEDHIGAVPHIVRRIDGPIYGTPFTLALLRPKLEEHGIDIEDRLVEVRPRQSVEIGPFRAEFLRMTHSIPDAVALAIHTPAGVIVHTGDFKIDQTPLDGQPSDLHRLGELGSAGVLLLLSDSTNADRPGFTGSERTVVPAFEEILSAAPKRVFVTAFSSSVYRLQLVADLADQFGRRVAFVGRGMAEVSTLAAEMGYLRIRPGTLIRDSDVRDYPPEEVLCLCTGSQGQALSALPRIAVDDHRHLSVEQDDVVVFSARIIPGNEKAVGRVMNRLARRGAEIVADTDKHVHVSGHGSGEELKLIISLIRPRFFVPIHGEYRQLARHARMATLVSPNTRCITVEDGDVLRFDEAGGRIVERVAAGRVLIDGTRTGEVADEVLRDRRHVAADGLLVPVVVINSRTGSVESPPEIIARGLSVDRRHDEALRESPALLMRAIESAPMEERTDAGLLKERIRQELQRIFRKRAGRRPLVLPVVLEV